MGGEGEEEAAKLPVLQGAFCLNIQRRVVGLPRQYFQKQGRDQNIEKTDP